MFLVLGDVFAIGIPQHIVADQAGGFANSVGIKGFSILMVYDISETRYGSANHILIALPLKMAWLGVYPVIF